MRAAGAPGRGAGEVPTPEEHALYHNLCILGIVNPGLRQEGIELARTSFRRSNNKALELVLFRLYCIIEGKARAHKDFKGIWPVLDKVQQTPFYQRIGDWMGELKKAGRLEPAVILPVSALKTNASNRLVLLLLELSTIALQHDLHASCPGASGVLCAVPQGSLVAGSPGLLDEQLVPPDLRLSISVTRAKQACGEFMSSAASASQACEELEIASLEFKRRYYELHALLRQQQTALASAPDAAPVAAAASPPRSSPGASSVPGGSSVLLGPAAAAVATAAAAGGNIFTPSAPSRPPLGPTAQAESLASLSGLLASLDEHLRLHTELAKVLMTDQVRASGGAGSDGAGAAAPPAQTHRTRGQVLHPHQIDGVTLAADIAAAGGGVGSGAAASGQHEAAQRQQGSAGAGFRPDNVVGAFAAFSSMLHALAPTITQLAISGDHAGPPPLLQPPSQPSSHAAHVMHQLQVHEEASRQAVQLSKRLQQQAGALEPVLRVLHHESRQVLAAEGLTDDGFAWDEEGPIVAAAPALPPPSPAGRLLAAGAGGWPTSSSRPDLQPEYGGGPAGMPLPVRGSGTAAPPTDGAAPIAPSSSGTLEELQARLQGLRARDAAAWSPSPSAVPSPPTAPSPQPQRGSSALGISSSKVASTRSPAAAPPSRPGAVNAAGEGWGIRPFGGWRALPDDDPQLGSPLAASTGAPAPPSPRRTLEAHFAALQGLSRGPLVSGVQPQARLGDAGEPQGSPASAPCRNEQHARPAAELHAAASGNAVAAATAAPGATLAGVNTAAAASAQFAGRNQLTAPAAQGTRLGMAVPTPAHPGAHGQDLRGLLDDDSDDDAYAGTLGLAAAPSTGADPSRTPRAALRGAGGGFESPRESDADGDADFGLLAAEGELVSRALMSGGGAAEDLELGAPLRVAEATQDTLGRLPLTHASSASGSSWGSGGGAMAEGGVAAAPPPPAPAPLLGVLAPAAVSDLDRGADMMDEDIDMDVGPAATVVTGPQPAAAQPPAWGAHAYGHAGSWSSGGARDRGLDQSSAGAALAAAKVAAAGSGGGLTLADLRARMQLVTGSAQWEK